MRELKNSTHCGMTIAEGWRQFGNIPSSTVGLTSVDNEERLFDAVSYHSIFGTKDIQHQGQIARSRRASLGSWTWNQAQG